MNYEEKYKALVAAIKKLQEANPSDDGIQNWVNDNVPELAEPEDEKIRKWLIGYFKQYRIGGMETVYASSLNVDDIIAWLEKQGDKLSKISHKYNIGDWIISKYNGIYQVKEVMSGSYNLLCTSGAEEINSISIVDNTSRLLTASDIQKLEQQYVVDLN